MTKKKNAQIFAWIRIIYGALLALGTIPIPIMMLLSYKIGSGIYSGLETFLLPFIAVSIMADGWIDLRRYRVKR